jgi:pSer/pThr/pTyr-binding forkhead associated (FHA) protein
MLKLVISDNEGTTTVVPFVRDEISIGRKDGNTIRLTERNISRRHCTFERVNGAYRVRDHGSYNGVVVNGSKIDGELPIKPGDQLQIGDYTLLIEAETNAVEPPTTELPKSMPPPPAPRPRSSDEPSETEPTRIAPLPKAPASPTPPKALSPSRLVVLTPPLAGAEFSLPERGELRIGRAEELEITIDHRSVSREHARLTCEGGRYRLTDRGSSNGVLVNGERVTDDELSTGDVIELGEVLVRFVAAGEAYVFDPDDVKELLRRKRRGSRGALLIAGAIVGAALVLAVVIVNGSRDEDEAGEAVASASGAVATSGGPQVSEDQRFGELLGACRAALSGGRFAESMAHAQQALKLRPTSSEAASCHTQARAQHEQEQAFVRAKAAYEGGDLGAAQKELELLTPGTPLASRPDVLALVQSVGEARVAEAEMLSGRDHGKAIELAHGVLRVPMLSPAHRQRADAVVASAGSEPAAPAVGSAPTARAARSTKDRERAPDRASALPKAPAGNEKPPIEVASACLARGDNACVVRALQGKAQSAQELGLLIETYRAMGNTAQAHKHMAMYVQRFPTARRAETYRIMLERANP